MNQIVKKVAKYTCITVFAGAVVAGGLGFLITPVADSAPFEAEPGNQPFSSKVENGSNYYRIPSMITTAEGTVVAAMDARFGGTRDSANNIDIALRTSVDNGENWSEITYPFYFGDHTNSKNLLKPNGKLKSYASASFIDSSLLEDTVNGNGRIFLLTDAYPSKTGSVNSEYGTGYVEIDGQQCLMLRKKGSRNFDYTVRGDNFIYDKNGNQTEYSLNSNFEILKNGQPLTVKQKKTIFWYNLSVPLPTKTEVPMNIMYESALFQPLHTTYLYLKYSDDQGKTWSDPISLNPLVKDSDSSFLGVCPGKGIQIKTGEFQGRLIFPVYNIDWEKGTQAFCVIYSDDHGETWTKGENVALNETVGSMSETQIIQYPDGTLQAFSRTQQVGKVASSYSEDGGVTWSDGVLVEALPLTNGSGCQLSVINYDGKIDGKDAVILSAPAGESRKNGYIYIGLINETGESGQSYNIDWKYKTEVTGEDVYFAYSCLTQLPNGEIGLLYEQSNTPQAVDTTYFKTFTIEALCQNKMEKGE